MPDIYITSERFIFFYCRTGYCLDCPGERHTATSYGSLEELCICPCHGKQLTAGQYNRVEFHQ